MNNRSVPCALIRHPDGASPAQNLNGAGTEIVALGAVLGVAGTKQLVEKQCSSVALEELLRLFILWCTSGRIGLLLLEFIYFLRSKVCFWSRI